MGVTLCRPTRSRWRSSTRLSATSCTTRWFNPRRQRADTNRAAIVGGHVDFIATALHHHHAAEGEVIWPKLRERAATREVDITRMEDTHRDIADDIARVRKIASSCADSADPRRASNSWASSSNSRPGWTSTSRTKSAASFRSSTPNSHPTNGTICPPASFLPCASPRLSSLIASVIASPTPPLLPPKTQSPRRFSRRRQRGYRARCDRIVAFSAARVPIRPCTGAVRNLKPVRRPWSCALSP